MCPLQKQQIFEFKIKIKNKTQIKIKSHDFDFRKSFQNMSSHLKIEQTNENNEITFGLHSPSYLVFLVLLVSQRSFPCSLVSYPNFLVILFLLLVILFLLLVIIFLLLAILIS